MGLPVIATNWSGPTAYMTEENSYPLPYDGLVTVEAGAFKKYHRWAEPSVGKLRGLMRQVFTSRADARVGGGFVSSFGQIHRFGFVPPNAGGQL